MVELGEIRQGLAEIEANLARLGAFPFRDTFLSPAYLRAGLPDHAISAVHQALAEERGRNQDSILYRVKGDAILTRDPSAISEAEACYRKAIEIARGQSAKWFELRATTSLARLLDKQGKRDEARAMLAEIYGWFTEGFDTADLKDAKALLDELTA